jgi:hypothetical protein
LVSKDGIDGVGRKLFKLRAKPPQRKSERDYNGLHRPHGGARVAATARKICDSLNSCAPHNK